MLTECFDWRKWRPKRGCAFVLPAKNAEKTDSGLYYTEKSAPWQPYGEVLKLGAPARREDGRELEWEIEVGDQVFYHRYACSEFDGEDGRVVDLCPVSAVISRYE